MNIIKLIRDAIKNGFISKAQKEEIKKAFSGLEAEDKEVIKEDYEKAMKLKVKEADEKEEDEDEEEDEEKEEETKSMLKTLLGNAKNEVLEETKKQVKEWLSEQQELMKASAGVYNKEIKKDRQKMNDYFRNLAKSLLNGDSDADLKLKELSTDSTGSPYGGYVVDTELSTEIRHLVTEYGVARREMTALQLSKGSYKANNLATDVTVYWGTEGGSMLSTQMVLGQELILIQLVIK
jgi:HK97 family phage major capsid protein